MADQQELWDILHREYILRILQGYNIEFTSASSKVKISEKPFSIIDCLFIQIYR